jgi:cephalosporin hydroxylase
MRLVDLVNSDRTDKNTTHSYLDLYQDIFENKKETAKNIMEIGIDMGGSIKLWHDYFTNATIYALDINHIDNIWEELKDKDRIKIYSSFDAYDKESFEQTFMNNDTRFDIIIDDGIHTLESVRKMLQMYSRVMTEDGILIIEDIQSTAWLRVLSSETPKHLKPFIHTYDFRAKKKRYDDLLFVIDKSRKNI